MLSNNLQHSVSFMFTAVRFQCINSLFIPAAFLLPHDNVYNPKKWQKHYHPAFWLSSVTPHDFLMPLTDNRCYLIFLVEQILLQWCLNKWLVIIILRTHYPLLWQNVFIDSKPLTAYGFLIICFGIFYSWKLGILFMQVTKIKWLN